MTESRPSTNLAGWVLQHAASAADQPALIIPREWGDDGITRVDELTFGGLAERVARMRGGLRAAGFGPNDRVVVMFPVSVELYVLVLALLAEGMVAVFVDLGMGKKRVFEALRLSRAKAIVSVDALLKLWPVLRVLWGRRRYSVDRRRLGVALLGDLDGEPVPEPVAEFDVPVSALMTFTSGSTGAPRAANRTHDILIAQHLALSEEFPAGDDEVDMPCFPVVPLHNLCCGITTVMPAVDLRAPATADAGLVVDQVAKYGVTRMTGAPAYLLRLCDELERRGGGLETVRTLGAGGAPVSPGLCRRLVAARPRANLLVIYGATEAEPMSAVPMAEVVAAGGGGYLVGRPSDAATLEVVRLPEPLPALDGAQMEPYRVSGREVGEVVVRGAHVLRGYVENPAADAETKLRAPDGGVWHRTGDMGFWDEAGRLWLVGRLPDVVTAPDGTPLHPYPIEVELEQLAGVRRAAVVAARGGGVVVVEPSTEGGAEAVVAAVRAWLDAQDLGWLAVEASEVAVDPRHNSKVARVQLRDRLER